MTFAGVSRASNPDWTGWKLIDQGASEANEDLQERVHAGCIIRTIGIRSGLNEIDNLGIALDIFSCSV